MKNKQVITALLLAFLFSTVSFFAQDTPQASKAKLRATPSMPGMQMRQGMMLGKLNMLKGLNLTEEQKGKMQQFKLDQEKEMIKIQSEIQLKKVELKEIFAEKQLNTSKLSGLTETIGKLELQTRKMKTDNWIKVYNLLNDEQKVIWKKNFAREGFMKQQGRMGRGMMQGQGRGMMQGQGRGMMQKQGRGMMQGQGRGMMQGQGSGMMQGQGRGMMQGQGHGMMQGQGHGMMQGQMDKKVKEEIKIEKK